PALHAERLPKRLGVPHDRVRPVQREALGLLGRGHARQRADRRRAPGAALVEKEDAVVAERTVEPERLLPGERPRRRRAGAALEEDEVRALAAVVRGHLACEERQPPAVGPL